MMWASIFFASRRRHTRLDCDWSSDVCSSDLYVAGIFVLGLFSSGMGIRAIRKGHEYYRRANYKKTLLEDVLGLATPLKNRSEERRVGESVDLGGRRIIKKKKSEYLVGGE